MRSPARWRKARNPNIGGRWSTPVNNHIWERQHGDDLELWRGDVHLATARPVPVLGESWEWSANIGKWTGWQRCEGEHAAKAEAKAEALRREAATPKDPSP